MNLCVAGCSFSDRTWVDKCYGDFLSDYTRLKYLHFARGCGSNQRSLRLLTRAILEKKITPGDVVILQYTNEHRREFASHNLAKIVPSKDTFISLNRSPWGEYFTSDYKYDSKLWQHHKLDQDLHRYYEQACSDTIADLEHFCTQHAMFEAFCKVHNINVTLLLTNYLEWTTSEWLRQHVYHFSYIHDTEFLGVTPEERKSYDLGIYGGNTEWDSAHLNEVGHQKLAQGLFDHLNKNIV
jgi:hypothetical protein